MMYKIVKRTILTLFLAGLSVYIVLTAFYFIVPPYLEKKILSHFSEDQLIHIREAKIHHVGLNSTVIGPVTLYTNQGKALRVETIRLTYLFKELLKKRVRTLYLSGADIRISYDNRSFLIGGSDVKSIISSFSSKSDGGTLNNAEESSEVVLPFDKVILNACNIILNAGGRILYVPFDLELTKDSVKPLNLHTQLSLHLFDQKLIFKNKIDLTHKTIETVLDLSAVDIGKQLSNHFFLKGSLPFDAIHADLSARIKMKWAPFFVEDLNGSFYLVNKDMVLSSSFQGLYKNDGSFSFKLGELNKKESVSGALKKGILNQHIVNLNPKENSEDLFIVKLNHFSHSFVIEGNKEKIKGVFHLKAPRGEVFKEKRLALKGASKTKIKRDKITLQWKDFFLKGDLHWEKNKKMDQSLLKWSAGCKRIETSIANRDETLTFFIPSLKLAGVFHPYKHLKNKQTGKNPTPLRKDSDPVSYDFNGTLSFSGAQFKAVNKELVLKKMALLLPFSFPFSSNTKRGQMSISSITYQKLFLGKMVGTLKPESSRIVLGGKVFNHQIKRGHLDFKGELLLPPRHAFETQFDITFKKKSEKTSYFVDTFFPSLRGVALNGDLNISGHFNTSRKGFEGKLCSTMTKGSIGMDEKNFSISQIDLKLCLPDLPQIRTHPMQSLTFKTFQSGDIRFDSGDIDFQIESDQSIFIEKGGFKWCNGQVYLQSTRLSPKEDIYHVNLYCDRIHLAQVLKQFGVADASGSGAVNGLIPIIYEKGQLRFNSGFLYSTPGKGGRIQLKDADFLSTQEVDIGKGVSQLDLAKEALKDFEYKWAKLSMVTKGEELLLKLQFDGKPAMPLPFAYNKGEGRFIRIDSNSKGSVFKGIAIDVNFRIPVDKLLQYKELMNFAP